TVIADMTELGQRIVLAQGSNGGFGNLHFKSATNQAPRRANPGLAGIERTIWLRLKLIADVGLLGLPNAGKSTFLAATSNARPKIADYPFTTLYPNLGVVSLGRDQSFVVADIPGVIEGAAAGAGLGLQFLKHLSRTRLLLHLVDIAPLDASMDPAQQVRQIERELFDYSPELADKERWLVLNKKDLLSDEAFAERSAELVTALQWRGPVYGISAATGDGLRQLTADLMARLESIWREEAAEREEPSDDEAWDPLL
ncbi:MAG: Obg family GTPase CgtA, partial [Candidatus Thiodiazotropha sp.]